MTRTIIGRKNFKNKYRLTGILQKRKISVILYIMLTLINLLMKMRYRKYQINFKFSNLKKINKFQ